MRKGPIVVAYEPDRFVVHGLGALIAESLPTARAQRKRGVIYAKPVIEVAKQLRKLVDLGLVSLNVEAAVIVDGLMDIYIKERIRIRSAELRFKHRVIKTDDSYGIPMLTAAMDHQIQTLRFCDAVQGSVGNFSDAGTGKTWSSIAYAAKKHEAG